MRSFLILVLALAIPMFLVGFGFRVMGLADRYQALRHPLNERPFYFIAYQGGSGERPANTWAAIENSRAKSWQILVWLDVHQTKDGKLVLFGHDYLEKQTNGKGHIGFNTWEDVQKLDAGYKFKENGENPYRGQGLRIRSLEETLQRFPNYEFVFNIKANSKNVDREIIALLEKYNRAENTIVTSPFEFVTKAIKKERPRWMYGVGLAELTRLMMFSSLWLGPAIPVRGDIAVTPRPHLKRASDRVLSELMRRKKKVIAWADSMKDWEKAKSRPVHGLITRNPGALINLINPKISPNGNFKNLKHKNGE